MPAVAKAGPGARNSFYDVYVGKGHVFAFSGSCIGKQKQDLNPGTPKCDMGGPSSDLPTVSQHPPQ